VATSDTPNDNYYPARVLNRAMTQAATRTSVAVQEPVSDTESTKNAQDLKLDRTSRSPRWALVGILVVQVGLSLRLVWSNTAFTDEALYLWAGRLEWSHWQHGTPIPVFATYFSGAPVVYPPLGALADSIGGLAGARILSLCFMLTGTTLLYNVTQRIFHRDAAVAASLLFVGLAATQFLGALATYDAMALMLLALAMWLGIRAAGTSAAARFALLMAAATVLAASDMTKYVCLLFDPVVVVSVAMYGWQQSGRRAGVHCAGVLLSTLTMVLSLALLIGGRTYWQGFKFTTLTRAASNAPAPGVLYASGKWLGGVLLLTVIGAAAVFAKYPTRPMRCVAVVLCSAVLLAPAEQARIHTITSLFKHVGFGGWFGCILAGFALVSFTQAVPAVKVRSAINVAATAAFLCALSGTVLAAEHYGGWPNTNLLMVTLRPILKTTHGPIYVGDSSNDLHYYLGDDVGSRTLISPWYFAWTDPVTGKRQYQAAAYADVIRRRYVSVVALDLDVPADKNILTAIAHYGGYRRVAYLPYVLDGTRRGFQVWVRQ
jgi:4-amino-4-deoxy-L-arabinose transferase-like glycosyltransferase